MTESIALQPRSSSSTRLILRMAIAALLAIAFLTVPAIHAQTPTPPPTATHDRGDMAGDWQGTVIAGKPRRLVLRVARADKNWTAKLYVLDDAGTQSVAASSVLLDHSTLKFSVDSMAATYEGTLNADGTSVTGALTMNGKPLQLILLRATKETAWEIPPPPAPSKKMAADADPSFEVATIKPNNSGATTLQGINVNGRNFTTRASSLVDLVSVTYGLHARQIVGMPDWANSDRYDIAALPDQEGEPDLTQLKTMIGKLLADRFSLKFHYEKREMSAYVIAVGKNGQKLTPTESKDALPGLGFRPGKGGLALTVQNATMSDLAGFLKGFVLDRPVVDQTGITGRFDFSVTFTPDDSQFNGHPPKVPPPSDTTESAPDLFTAFQQQIGLKLTVEKVPVDVLVIDHVEKPSPN